MADKTPFSSEFTAIEQQIQQLIQSYSELKRQHEGLQSKVQTLSQENQRMATEKQQTEQRMEAILSRLQTLGETV